VSRRDLPRVGFTGHQGLPELTVPLIRDAIAAELAGEGPVHGFCSLAEGSDQLFAGCVIDAGGFLNVIVPCQRYELAFTDQGALARYHAYLARAEQVINLSYPEPSEEAFWSAGKRVVEESERMIAVWDGRPSRGLGGTADVVALARESGRHVKVIWPRSSARL